MSDENEAAFRKNHYLWIEEELLWEVMKYDKERFKKVFSFINKTPISNILLISYNKRKPSDEFV